MEAGRATPRLGPSREVSPRTRGRCASAKARSLGARAPEVPVPSVSRPRGANVPTPFLCHHHPSTSMFRPSRVPPYPDGRGWVYLFREGVGAPPGWTSVQRFTWSGYPSKGSRRVPGRTRGGPDVTVTPVLVRVKYARDEDAGFLGQERGLRFLGGL